MTGTQDVSDEIEFRNGKGNPFGFSYEEIWHDGKKIGQNVCGQVEITDKQYFHTITDEGHRTVRLTIYKWVLELKEPK